MIRRCLIAALVFVLQWSYAQETSPNIVIDQFGYLPDARKVAVLRDPQVGFDAEASYVASKYYTVVNATTGESVYRGQPSAWKSGSTDQSSGDKVHHFDFSQITQTGTYYIYDEDNHLRSYSFVIAPDIYNNVLKQAMRSFFYQRVGMEKKQPYAEAAWEDEASHVHDGQDNNCRSWFDKNNPDSERDVSGGWYDAGDFNKYTNWTANYVVDFLRAYLEKPAAWGDDYDIPESGNGIPDILDETLWGLDHLLRMQMEDGAVLSIVGEAHASPPSEATAPSYYGPPNTSATLNTCAAFALGATVYREIGLVNYADTLLVRALRAWDWAEIYPDSLFRNNDSSYGSSGLGAGQQETDDYGRDMARLEAACHLFEATGESRFHDYFKDNYRDMHMFQWNFTYTFETSNQDIVLHYTSLDSADASVRADIRNVYGNATINGSENLAAYRSGKDPYRAHMKDYVWGSNGNKAGQGSMYYNLLLYGMEEGVEEDARDAAEACIHNLHGVNPMNLAYLSNMYAHGAENCVNQFYHTWFQHGSPKWDCVGESEFGPAPGFLPGGPNPGYNWDGCCPSGCGSSGNNAKCKEENIYPPKDQPDQKSYKDFNNSWPLNSWSVTENSCGYQTRYIRLLSKFVTAGVDCNGEAGGAAFMDSCGICAGGSTGIEPSMDPGSCVDLFPVGEGDTMFIEGRHLFSPAGEKVVLRGVNEMFAWGDDPEGERTLPEIDQTGANAVRLVWTEEMGQKDRLVKLIENTIGRKMIAMPECHSATGDWSKLDVCISFWKDPVLLEGIQRNRRWTLVNIGNEVGDGNVTATQFESGYKRAIDSLRLWGYTVPLVIDAPTWGQNLDVILATWKNLQEHDPLHNVLFSVHSYWADTDTYHQVVNAVVNDSVPLIIGEGPSPTRYPSCSILDYSKGMNACGKNDVGWLSWSWGALANGHCVPNFDHTDDGYFGLWKTDYGEDMMVDHAYSLMRTAERPVSFYEDSLVVPSGIYIGSGVEELPLGDSLPLVVLVAPANVPDPSWILDIQPAPDGGTALYNPNSGYIHGLSEGVLVLKVSSEAQPDVEWYREIEVVYIPVESLHVEPGSASIKVGESLEVEVQVVPENASEPAFYFEVRGAEVISFDSESRTVTGLAPGHAVLDVFWSHGDVRDSVQVEVIPGVSVPETAVQDLFVYPNPASTSLRVDFETEGRAKLALLDMNGRVLLEKEHQGSSLLDTAQLSTGTYVLRISTGGRYIRRKILILR